MLTESSIMQEVEISRLKKSPIQVTLHSAKTIQQIASAAKSPQQRNEIAPVKVACLKESMFLVDGHAIVEGLKLAGMTSVRAIVYHASSVNDILALHVRFNQHSPLDPFELIEIINFMIETGELPDQIQQRLQLRDHLARLIGCHIANKEAKNRLREFTHALTERYTNVVIPPYFAELISKIPEKIQLEAVEQFIAIMDQPMPNRKFAFPGPETLEIYFRQYIKNREREPVFFTHENASKKDAKISQKSPDPKDVQLAKEIIGMVPGMAILRVDKPGLYRVNMVKRTISPIKEKDNLTIIEGDDGCKIFSLPQSAVEFLDIVDDASDVSVKTFNGLQLREFASKITTRNSKFVVISGS